MQHDETAVLTEDGSLFLENGYNSDGVATSYIGSSPAAARSSCCCVGSALPASPDRKPDVGDVRGGTPASAPHATLRPCPIQRPQAAEHYRS